MSFLISFNKICNKKLSDFKQDFEVYCEEYQKSISAKKRIFTKNLNKGLIEKDEVIKAFEEELENVEKYKASQIESFVNFTNDLLENYPAQTLEEVKDYKNSISNPAPILEHYKTKLNDVDENSCEINSDPPINFLDIGENEDFDEDNYLRLHKEKILKEIHEMIKPCPIDEMDKMKSMIMEYIQNIPNKNGRKRSIDKGNVSESSKKTKTDEDVKQDSETEEVDKVTKIKTRQRSRNKSTNDCSDVDIDSISIEPSNNMSNVNINPPEINNQASIDNSEATVIKKLTEIETATSSKMSITSSNPAKPLRQGGSSKLNQSKLSSSVYTPKSLYYSKYYREISESTKKKALESTQKKMISKPVQKERAVPLVNDNTKSMRQLAEIKMKNLKKEREEHLHLPSTSKADQHDAKKNQVGHFPVKNVTTTTAIDHMKANKWKPTSGLVKKPHLSSSTVSKKMGISKDCLKPIIKNNTEMNKQMTKGHLKNPNEVPAKKLVREKENTEPHPIRTKQTDISTSESSLKSRSKTKTSSLHKESRKTDILSQSFMVIIDNHESVDIEDLPSDSDDDDENIIKSLPCPEWSKNPAIISRLQQYNSRHLKPTELFRPPQLLDINLERMFSRYGYKEKAPRGSSVWLPIDRNMPIDTSDVQE